MKVLKRQRKTSRANKEIIATHVVVLINIPKIVHLMQRDKVGRMGTKRCTTNILHQANVYVKRDNKTFIGYNANGRNNCIINLF